MNEWDPGLALSQSSGGSRAANADDGAARKHAAFHSSREPDRKAPPQISTSSERRRINHPELRKRTGRCGQCRTRLGAVVVHLAHQRVGAVELQLVADEGDEGDVQRRPVKIALEIEQEYFQQRRAIVEGRAAAEACDAIEALGTTADPHRIDAVLEAAVLVEADIGGGIAELAAAFLAMDHLACNEPGAAEH